MSYTKITPDARGESGAETVNLGNDFPTQVSEAQDFLNRWAPGGPWVLTAINPERKGIDTKTFTDARKAQRFIDGYNGKRNIYFHVNPTIGELEKKADREDIRELAWLHVDIDPRAGEDIEAERERARRLLMEDRPAGIPEPTCIVFSGGGYQGFWKIDEPLPINGELAKAEDVKRYNQRLEQVFGADQCHNIDRIMRVPGTVNVPDAKKRKKGRERVNAHLVHWADVSYPITDFTAAPAHPTPSGGAGSTAVDLPSGGVKRLDSVDELDEYGVPDRIKEIIVQGEGQEPKEHDNSRSAWVFDVACGLVRCGVPDATIYAILTDPDLGISASILDKGNRAEKYAIRQIQQAKDQTQLGTDGMPTGLDRDEKTMEIRATLENTCRVVGTPQAFGYQIGHDRFLGQTMIAYGDSQWREMREGDPVKMRRQLGRLGFKPVGRDMMRDAITDTAEDNEFDSAMQWLTEEIPAWDGVPRVGRFFADYFKVADTEYTRECSFYTWTALAGRVLSPGCTAGMAPILHGEQGLLKSSGLKCMVPDLAFFTPLDLASKPDDLNRMIRGKLLVELEELRGLSMRDVNYVKSFITQTRQEWTPKYCEMDTHYDRRCVLIGTTNEQQFLADSTGHRRFLPMTVEGAVDCEAITRDRDQLWAEGRELYRQHGVLYKQAERLAKAEHEAYEITDVWREPIERWLKDMERPFALGELLSDALEMPPKQQLKTDENRAASVLKALGYDKKQRGRARLSRWAPKGT